MNRRNFFNLLGSAILGTAIALRIPDNIVPQILLPSPEADETSFSFSISDSEKYWFGFTGFKPSTKDTTTRVALKINLLNINY